MPLRLHSDGLKMFDEWRSRPSTSPEDEHLAAQLLTEYADQQGWQVRRKNYGLPGDRNITVVELREGLYMHIVRWTGDVEDEFSLARIGDYPGLDARNR